MCCGDSYASYKTPVKVVHNCMDDYLSIYGQCSLYMCCGAIYASYKTPVEVFHACMDNYLLTVISEVTSGIPI